MKRKKLDPVEVSKQLEDVLAPRLKLSVLDRAVYSHLLRHSRFEGKLRLRFSIVWLANNMGVTSRRVRQAVRRLIDHGVLRLIERSNIGHLVEVRLPWEVRVPCASRSGAKLPAEPNLDELDFQRTPALRQAIHAREGGLCFYCLHRTPSRARCLDHVVPVAKSGTNSYRNLVSAASTATPGNATFPPRIFCACSTAKEPCRARTSPTNSANSKPSPPASSAQRFSVTRMREPLVVQKSVVGQLPVSP